jgi:hypothetical protein
MPSESVDCLLDVQRGVGCVARAESKRNRGIDRSPVGVEQPALMSELHGHGLGNGPNGSSKKGAHDSFTAWPILR